MSLKATFDENQKPIAFYHEGIHADIPENAVSISDEHHDLFMQNHGLARWADGDVNIESAVEPLEELQQRLKDEIDIEAGLARNRLTAKGDKITNEYELVIRKCNEWHSAGRPANAIPAILQDEVEVTGDSAGDICDLFLSMKDQAEEAERIIRKIRRRAARRIKNETDESIIKQHAQQAIDELGAIPQ